MLLRLKDANGVPVVVPVMFNKQHGKAIIDVVTSAYSKKEESNPKAFNYNWLDKNLTNQKILYVDKEKSTEWLRSIRNQYPTGMVAFSHALSGNIIATFDDIVNTENKSSTDENGVEFQILDENNPDNKKIIDKLNKDSKEGKTFKAYRAMVEYKGKLYPPMASKEDAETYAPSSEIGKWEQSVENPSKAFYTPKGKSTKKLMLNDTKPIKKDGIWQAEVDGKWIPLSTDTKTGDPALYFELIKDNGDTIPARYNPYLHSSKYMLNDQFYHPPKLRPSKTKNAPKTNLVAFCLIIDF